MFARIPMNLTFSMIMMCVGANLVFALNLHTRIRAITRIAPTGDQTCDKKSETLEAIWGGSVGMVAEKWMGGIVLKCHKTARHFWERIRGKGPSPFSKGDLGGFYGTRRLLYRI